jgi:hypothetical protein
MFDMMIDFSESVKLRAGVLLLSSSLLSRQEVTEGRIMAAIRAAIK